VASNTERSAVVAASQRSLSQWPRQAEASTAAAMARKTKVKGRGHEQARGGAEAGERGDGGDDEQILAPGDRQAEDGEEEEDGPGRPGGDGVKAQGGLPE